MGAVDAHDERCWVFSIVSGDGCLGLRVYGIECVSGWLVVGKGLVLA